MEKLECYMQDQLTGNYGGFMVREDRSVRDLGMRAHAGM